MRLLTVGAVVIALAFGVALVATYRQVADLQVQLAREQQTTAFIMAPQTIAQSLAGADEQAAATIYVQPGSTQALLRVYRLPRAAPGTIYQFWLARAGAQIPSNTFDVGADGSALVALDAPAPLGQYDQIMVTVEPAGGSPQPSPAVVLAAPLPTPDHR
jgi:hypothetical protein